MPFPLHYAVRGDPDPSPKRKVARRLEKALAELGKR